jgi:hypothetical protein
VLSVIFIVVTLILWINHLHQIDERQRVREQIQTEISNQINAYKRGEISVIDLSKISSFVWTRLYIYGPYVPLEIIQEELGTSWHPDTPWSTSIDRPFVLLVFTLDEKIVQYVEYPITLGNFSEAGEKLDGYATDEAVFGINEYGYVVWLNE